MMEGLLSIFGVYRGTDRNRFDLPPADQLPYVDGDGGLASAPPLRIGVTKREVAHAP